MKTLFKARLEGRFSHFRSLRVRKSVCVNGFWLGSENQSTRYSVAKVSSRCLHYLLTTILEDQGGPPTWRLHTKLYNFVRNISTNISTLGQCTHQKLRKLSSLFIVFNITISWLYPLQGFWIYFSLCDNAHTLYGVHVMDCQLNSGLVYSSCIADNLQ